MVLRWTRRLLLTLLVTAACLGVLVFPDVRTLFSAVRAAFSTEGRVLDHISDVSPDGGPAPDVDEPKDGSRRLQVPVSSRTSWFTGESLVTNNGRVPAVSCPKGTYRIASSSAYNRASGQRMDGCVFCPRGRYGEQAGLTTRFCTDACPKGRYRDTPGAKSQSDCRLCPPGKIGSVAGMTTSECTANCPTGMYSDESGVTSDRQCKVCPTGYRGWQCAWPQAPRKGTFSTEAGVINEAAHIYISGASIPQGSSPIRFSHTYTPLENTEDPITVQ